MDCSEALYHSRDYTTDSQITEQVKTISMERLGSTIEPSYPRAHASSPTSTSGRKGFPMGHWIRPSPRE
eukprot:12921574-Prorocentrum_lima.AAC.1